MTDFWVCKNVSIVLWKPSIASSSAPSPGPGRSNRGVEG